MIINIPHTGGGKSTALDAFEDMAIVSIISPNLLKEFIHLHQNSPSDLEALAVVMDLRLGIFEMSGQVEELKIWAMISSHLHRSQ